MTSDKVNQVYQAKTIAEQQATYDHWAEHYEQDLCAMGYRHPMHIAALFAHMVDKTGGPFLDVGCGGGIQSEALSAMGYRPLIGIDLSPSMLKVARDKQIYDQLLQMQLGLPLAFPDNQFGALICSGTYTNGHAPPDSFEELIRIGKPGALFFCTMRDDDGQDPSYLAKARALEQEGKWREAHTGAAFFGMPYGEPDVVHRVRVYEIA